MSVETNNGTVVLKADKKNAPDAENSFVETSSSSDAIDVATKNENVVEKLKTPSIKEIHADMTALVQQNQELIRMLKEFEKYNQELSIQVKRQAQEIEILKNANPNQEIDYGENFGLPLVRDLRDLTHSQRVLLMKRKFMKDAKRAKNGKRKGAGSGIVGELSPSTAPGYRVNLTPRQ